MTWIDLIGYTGSLLVVLSMTMASVLRLRLLSVAGSSTFLVYAVIIQDIPILLVNVAVLMVNTFHLIRLRRRQEIFDLVPVEGDSPIYRLTLEREHEEISRFVPEFEPQDRPGRVRWMVFRDLVPAGLFVADPVEDGTWLLQLDYALPTYRDMRVGRHVYEDHRDRLLALGIRRLVARPTHKAHRAYLKRVGFQPVADTLVMELSPPPET